MRFDGGQLVFLGLACFGFGLVLATLASCARKGLGGEQMFHRELAAFVATFVCGGLLGVSMGWASARDHGTRAVDDLTRAGFVVDDTLSDGGQGRAWVRVRGCVLRFELRERDGRFVIIRPGGEHPPALSPAEVRDAAEALGCR